MEAFLDNEGLHKIFLLKNDLHVGLLIQVWRLDKQRPS